MNIVLLDPGLSYPKTQHIVDNVGDLIISEAINKKITKLFPHENIIRIPSHYKLSSDGKRTIKKSDIVFIGGTNLLSSYFKKMNRPLGPNKSSLRILFPELKNVILFGVGWGYGHDKPLDNMSIRYYRKIFKPNSIQSVRDFESEYKLRKSGINNAVNTNCPTMWGLNGIPMDLKVRVPENNQCLFTLTDYLKDFKLDNLILGTLAERFRKLVFFPQGKGDELYLKMLPCYNKYKAIITILDRSLTAYDDFVDNNDFVYIGTRLHGGIRCLQKGKPALIISIDNRAEDIAKDTNLACIQRSEYTNITKWLDGRTKFGNINLNLEGINAFISQF
jgi:hypothetical protein